MVVWKEKKFKTPIVVYGLLKDFSVSISLRNQLQQTWYPQRAGGLKLRRCWKTLLVVMSFSNGILAKLLRDSLIM